MVPSRTRFHCATTGTPGLIYSRRNKLRRGREARIYFLLSCTGQNPLAITISLGVLAILGLVIIAAALMCVFRVQKQSDTYQVNQTSPRQPKEAAAAE